MGMDTFVHLEVQSSFSFLWGTFTPQALVEEAIALGQKAGAVVIDETDAFGVVGILIKPFADMTFDHIVKHLEHVTNDPVGILRQYFQELIKRDGFPLIGGIHVPVQLLDGF